MIELKMSEIIRDMRMPDGSLALTKSKAEALIRWIEIMENQSKDFSKVINDTLATISRFSTSAKAENVLD